MNSCIRINPKDNVAVMLCDAAAGDTIRVGGIALVLQEQIPFGHKVALQKLEIGDVIYKYGQPIGRCTKAAAVGSWVHTHNCESLRGGVAR